ncbi:MAG: DUF3014 domain-containing protein [Gammaproteobacteria bacterium]|nr:DUF3014 domain-containing protein [Gammaproteobacteria bacterium]
MSSRQDSKWPMVVTVLALAVIGALYFRGLQQPLHDLHTLTLPSVPTPVAAPSADEPATIAEPAVVNPIEQSEAGRQQAPAAAPSTASDAAGPAPTEQSFEAALEAVLGSDAFRQWVVSDDLINRIVVAVDNLSHDKLPVRLWPLRPLGNLPLVNGDGGALRFAPDNAARYDAYIAVLEKLDMKRLAALYVREYPRFQSAFEALGYPKAYFNDRLVDVIDHLLVTPEVATPLALVQPTVMYKFADAGLESRSVGQKLLLRMGPAHASVVKSRLRELLRLVSRSAQ